MTTIYIAGPMSGLPKYNRPKFNMAEGYLRVMTAHDVINPAHVDLGEPGTWQLYMRGALAQLVECDAIVMLDGWEQSRGALLEKHVGEQLGIRIDTDLSERVNRFIAMTAQALDRLEQSDDHTTNQQ